MYQIVKSITFALFVLFANMLYAQEPVEFQQETLEFKEGLPEGFESIEAIDNQMALDAQGNWVHLFAPPQEDENIVSRSASSYIGWSASGYGPGQLWYQDDPRFSNELSASSSFGGYITSINYMWSGDLRGWSNVKVILMFIDGSTGKPRYFKDVSNNKRGSIRIPYGYITSDYHFAFGYMVDRKPKLRIHDGPIFGDVQIRVHGTL